MSMILQDEDDHRHEEVNAHKFAWSKKEIISFDS